MDKIRQTYEDTVRHLQIETPQTATYGPKEKTERFIPSDKTLSEIHVLKPNLTVIKLRQQRKDKRQATVTTSHLKKSKRPHSTTPIVIIMSSILSISSSPALHNIVMSIIPVIWVKSVIYFMSLLVAHKVIDAKIGRKISHICAGSFIIFWPLFDSDHWTWRFNILVYVIYATSLFVKGAITRDVNDPDVIALCRRGDPTELLYGPVHFSLASCYFGIVGFNTELGVLIFSCLGFGDGIAPIVGMTCPYGYYKTFPFKGPNADQKTISGSIGFFIGSVIGYCILRPIVLGEIADDFSRIVPVAATAAIAEGLSGDYDNLVVSIVSYLVAQKVL